MGRLTRDGTAEPVTRDQIFRHKRGQGNVHFPCQAHHVQDWQPYPVDPCSCYMCEHTDISNANPARGYKTIRRPTGRIMVTTRYSIQQGSKSRQNPYQVQPTQNTGNLSASRRCLWVQATVSTVWSDASITEPELQATEMTV